jgi:protein-L-isoaspartate O-methyltransferase
VEINPTLVAGLKEMADRRELADCRCGDFLEMNGELGTFDRIVMNPPFADAADIRHILHARAKLKPGGRLVAICANGPRQRAALGPIADAWIDLPAGSFKESGTGVNAAIVVMGPCQ